MSFINLHNHTAKGSLLDSILTVDQMVDFCVINNQPAIALTDHGTLSSFVDFYKACIKKHILPIIGCELYEVDDDQQKNDTRDNKQPRYHLIVLAKNRNGLKNLLKIVSYAGTDGKYIKPRISVDRIIENGWGKDIVCMTACQAGRLSRLVCSYKIEEAKQWVNKLQAAFDYVAVEIQSHKTDSQYEANYRLFEFAKQNNLPFVVSCDAHYLSTNKAYAQSKFVLIGEDREVGESYVDCYLQSEDDVRRNLNDFDDEDISKAINETAHIASMIEEYDIGMLDGFQMPKTIVPNGYNSHMEYLRYLIYSTFDKKFSHLPEEEQQKRRDRIEMELPVLEYVDYVDYFLMVHDLLAEARAEGVVLGPARGSAAGCLCLYMLDVTQIDSVLWDLDFARFASRSRRGTLADIDIDIARRDRKKLIRIAERLFGEKNVAPICTFNTLSTKVAIRDLGKCLNEDETSPYFDKIPYSIRNEVANAIPAVKSIDELGQETEKELLLKDLLSQNPKLQKYYEEFPLWFELVMELESLPKSMGTHAAGCIIAPKPIVEYAPLCNGKDGMKQLSIEMNNCMTDLKLVKMDFLGLKTLDTIDDTLTAANLTWDDVNFNTLNFHDKETYDATYGSSNCTCCFQFESSESQQMCVEAKADSPLDVIAISALNRPGAKESFPEYCKNKFHPEDADVVHPDLLELFAETHGVLIYQEECMAIFRYAGFDDDSLDDCRKAISKKKVDVMAKMEPQFKDGLKIKGWTEEQCNKMWDLVLKQAGYSFNKCVSGDTVLWRDAGRSKYRPTVAEMYKIKHDGKYARATGHRSLHSKYINNRFGFGHTLSMFEDGRIHPNRIIDIYYSGQREVFRIITESGKEIKATSNHKFPTVNGEKQLCELQIGDSLYTKGEYEICTNKYNLTDGNFEKNYPVKGQFGFQKKNISPDTLFHEEVQRHILRKDCCEICGARYESNARFELHHIDFDRTHNDLSNYQWLCCSCHKKVHYVGGRTRKGEKGYPVVIDKIVQIIPCGAEDVYDIKMADPAHNFVTSSGIVTCNSHACAYGLLSYITAYLKTHYPVEYLSSCLTQDSDNPTRLSVVINEARRLGIKVLPPNINKSNRDFTPLPDKNSILFGLLAIKGLGESIVDTIIANRPYKSFDEFIEKVPQKTAVIQLIKAGAFTISKKEQLLESYCNKIITHKEYKPVTTIPSKAELLMKWGIDTNTYKTKGKLDKELLRRDYNLARQIQFESSEKERYAKELQAFKDKYMQDMWLSEFETLNLFITSDPLEFAYDKIRDFEQIETDTDAVLIGVIVGIQRRKDSRNQLYCFIQLYTRGGIKEAICWSSATKQYIDIIKKGNVVAIYGKKTETGNIMVNKMKLYKEWLDDKNLKHVGVNA